MATPFLPERPGWCETNGAPNSGRGWENYNWDTALSQQALQQLADLNWTCLDHFGCSPTQDTCWLIFSAPGFELHAHVNVYGNEDRPFNEVQDKPNKILSLARKSQTGDGLNDSICSFMKVCNPANSKVLSSMGRLSTELQGYYPTHSTLLKKLHDSIPY